MLTKLAAFKEWPAVKNDQDVVRMVELLRLVYHKKVTEVMQAVKTVFLHTIDVGSKDLDNCQGNSRANVEVCKALGIRIGRYEAAADIVLKERGLTFEEVKK